MHTWECPNCKMKIEHVTVVICGTCSDFPDDEYEEKVYMELVK